MKLLPITAAALCALGLAACGDEGDGSTDDGRAVAAKSSLSIALTGPKSTRAFTLRCEPDGGTWPNAKAACDGLRASPGVLEAITNETRDLQPITEVPITVTGEFDGKAVSVVIPAQGSGTRKIRFGELLAALGPDAFAQAAKSVQ